VKSSDGRRFSDSSALVHALLIALSIALIGGLRSGLAERFAQVKVKADTYLLPSAETALVGSLGYRAALADFIFAHVLVSYGLHWEEKRLYESVGDYLNVINTLDPKFRDPYLFADTLVTLQPKEVPFAYYERARHIQERGLKELPYDQELWLTAGQYLAYIVAPRLKDAAKAEEYRHNGARDLMHACELIGSNENIPYHCVTAANLLNEEGSRDAARSFLERMLASTEDPEVRGIALNYLRRVDGEADRARAQRREQRLLQAQIRDGLVTWPRVELDALGPGWDTARCAGLASFDDVACANSWRRLAELDEQAHDAAR